jgi:xanthine dehydrogenase accessory factor
LNQRAALYAEQIIPTCQSGRKTFRWNEDEVDAFFEVYLPPPELVVVGAVHVAVPLVQFAKSLGFKTIVVDPREVFAAHQRFEGVDQILVSWPEEALAEIGLHGGSYVAILSHDLKIDVPALELALRSPARYIGVLGSKKTHAKRVALLREMGFDDDEIARIHSPVGLDLGGRRAEEIALSIIAEMVAVGHGRSTKSLTGG